jgi:hypothetical protein
MNTTQMTRLAALLAGPRKSDRALREALGVSQGELVALGAGLREALGLAVGASLRDAIRVGGIHLTGASEAPSVETL